MDLALPEALLSPLKAIVYYLPAYAANGAPVVVKGRRPIDGGRVFIDGRRILGDGKTWEGLAAGLAAGAAATAVIVYPLLGDVRLALAALLAAVAGLGGDMLASFVKRRLGLARGEPLPVIDQLDFFIAASLVLKLLGVPITLLDVTTLAVVTYALHRATNYAAYKLGLKSVPW